MRCGGSGAVATRVREVTGRLCSCTRWGAAVPCRVPGCRGAVVPGCRGGQGSRGERRAAASERERRAWRRRMRGPGAGASRGRRGAAPPVSTRESGAARVRPPPSTARFELRKVLPWRTPGPPSAACSTRVSARPAPVSLRPLLSPCRD